MKERAPAFQFYPRQFAGDDRVMGMDLEAIGAHILLMCAAAASPERCRIDADEYAIRMRLRNPSDEAWQRIKKQLMAGAWKVSSDGKWWIQSGLERTFQKQKEFSDKQREKANQKWGKGDAATVPESCQTDAGVIPDGMPKVCSSSSSSSSKNSSSEQKTCSDQGVASVPMKMTTTPSREACKLAALLKAEILRNKVDYRITPTQSRQWEITADRMLRLDNRTPEQVEGIIRWAQRDDFWMANVLSMDTLREKFDQLDMKRRNSNGNGHPLRKAPVISGSAVDNTLALLEAGAQ
ncbi:MAG: hypothetical protein JWQ87_3559 [Candidatus Sulfotelmatobacter sp.]|nr:hypothetical protein [Candidatus Sulfotelmatobacter sp.]